MPLTISQFLDHGTQNPIVARLAVQTLEIIGQCNIADATRNDVVDIYINSLIKKLLRCWEIAERYRLDFNKQVESYKPPVAGAQMVSVPSVVGLEQECHNFLYEAKSFIRDALKAFNLLYGTGFVEASEYARPKKKGLIFVSWAAENLRMPNFLRIVCVPRENRDANNPVKYFRCRRASIRWRASFYFWR